MELEIKRRETVGGGASARAESETVAKYEIMDGGPARGEVIPIRLHLSPYELTPSYPNVHNKFAVRYSLNLVLVDDEDRRYFKQQEIMLYRSPPADAGEGNGQRVSVLTPRTAGKALSSAISTAREGDSGTSQGLREEMQSSEQQNAEIGEVGEELPKEEVGGQVGRGGVSPL